jgi:hypothetical protein
MNPVGDDVRSLIIDKAFGNGGAFLKLTLDKFPAPERHYERGMKDPGVIFSFFNFPCKMREPEP